MLSFIEVNWRQLRVNNIVVMNQKVTMGGSIISICIYLLLLNSSMVCVVVFSKENNLKRSYPNSYYPPYRQCLNLTVLISWKTWWRSGNHNSALNGWRFNNPEIFMLLNIKHYRNSLFGFCFNSEISYDFISIVTVEN